MKFADSLKAVRRGIYVHADKYRTAVIAPGDAYLSIAFSEAKALMQASSLAVERVSPATMTIQTERGGIIRFFRISDYMDTYALRGVKYPHIIMLGTPSLYRSDVMDVIHAQNLGVDGDTHVLHWVDDI